MEYRFSDYDPSSILRGHLKLGGASPSGGSIEVNSLYIERDGQPWIGVMGEYHFARDSRERWAAELEKIRDGGVNIVSTYVFWLYHEEIEGEFDFTGDRDLRAFVLACQNAGLDVFIRVGPWCHGETRNGGFPDWLVKSGLKLRTNDPEYMEKVRLWYTRIARELRGLFHKDGGPIIGIQLENELVDRPNHLLALKKLAISVGLEAPLWTATGWNSRFGARIPPDELLPVFGAYADAPWSGFPGELSPNVNFSFNPMRNNSAIGDDILPEDYDDGWRMDYSRFPFVTCELGPGLQPTHRRRPTASPMDAYAMSLVKLGCGNNLMGYYMYHGGTNKIGRLSTLQESRASGSPNDVPILNYDFQAPISQYGEKRPHYGLLNLLHLFVQDFGRILAPMEHVGAEKFVPAEDSENLRYAMRTDGRGGFIFVNHHQRHLTLEDVEDAVFCPLGLRLPPIPVCGDIAFILPFNLELGGETLEWSTAQLLCRDGDTYLFTALPDIEPMYKFAGREAAISGPELEIGGIRVKTLSWEMALRLRRTGGKIWYEDAATPADTPFSLTPCPQPFEPPYIEELRLSGDVPLIWHRLSVPSPAGFVTVPLDFDTAQLYIDGVLAADKFSDALPWRLPAAMIFQKNAYLVHTPPVPGIYKEPHLTLPR